MQIPLNYKSRPDSWFWMGKKKNMYSVKDGYRLMMSNVNVGSSRQLTDFRKGIWALEVPNKVRSFI